ncbi:unnamed protein product [Plutella xylostella]|nr:unnamed protein product [Plutella xylostella]
MKLTAYVANRVKAITNNTADCQWLYVNTKENPADYISRGVSPHELSGCDMWWHGPRFMHDSKYKFDENIELPAELPESRASAAISSNVGSAARPVTDILQGIHKYSSIQKMAEGHSFQAADGFLAGRQGDCFEPSLRESWSRFRRTYKCKALARETISHR